MRREQGFTLVELLIAMTMFIIIIASVSSVFAPLLTQFKQQSKSAETQIEGIIGLEMLRRDIKHAGFGLPWNIDGATYDEASDDGTDWNDTVFNDSPANPPAAIRSDNLGLYDSDVLVLKAANLATNGASQKWTLLGTGGVNRNEPPGDDEENLSGDAFCSAVSSRCPTAPDRVIVIAPGNTDVTRRTLVRSDDATLTSWKTTYPAATTAASPFAPTGSDINIIYGIKSGSGAVSATDPRMPFNRTDYYIRIPGTMPDQCAAGTGILYRGDVNHSNGEHNELPVFDCVADFQVVYTVRSDTPDCLLPLPSCLAEESYTNGLTAAEIRERIAEVSVYILAQDGQKDPTNCTATNPCVANPLTVGPGSGDGRDFDFEDNGITDWQNYRWKVYTITVTMENLG